MENHDLKCDTWFASLKTDTSKHNARLTSFLGKISQLSVSIALNTNFYSSMRDFTYGKRISRAGSNPMTSKIKLRLMKLEERRLQRATLKLLYERKAASVCGTRDRAMLEKLAEQRQTVPRV
jgi:hypothetical protein